MVVTKGERWRGRDEVVRGRGQVRGLEGKQTSGGEHTAERTSVEC